MEKIINIDGRNVKFKSTGAYLLRYKSQFGRDAIQDIYRLTEVIDMETKEIKDITALDLEVFYNLIWVLAKTADSAIDLPLEWLDTFSEFPVMDIIPEVMDMIMSCMTPTVKSTSKKK